MSVTHQQHAWSPAALMAGQDADEDAVSMSPKEFGEVVFVESIQTLQKAGPPTRH